jgi:O-antigen/teichoic acid export membrane protein
LKAAICKLAKGKFAKNVGVVIFGSAITQIVGFAIMPLLARLYTPADFGVFGNYNAVVGVIVAGVTLQYSQALVLPEQEDEATRLFALSCLSTIAISAIIFVIGLAFPTHVLNLFKTPDAYWLLFVLPVALVVSGWNQTVQSWSIRRKKFKANAFAQVTRTTSGGAVQLTGGYFGGGASNLIAGSIISDIAASIALGRTITKNDRRSARENINLRDLVITARKYIDFPLYATPQNLINAASQGLPVVILSYYYGVVVGGFYAIGIRLIRAPTQLIIGGVRQVLFQRAAETYNRRLPLGSIYWKSTAGLGMIIVGPLILGFLFSPWIFRSVLGSDWETAGEYAKWLILWTAIGFCNVPAMTFGRILRQQRNLLIYDVTLLILRMLVLVAGGTYFTALTSIITFSLLGATSNAFLIFWMGHHVSRLDSISRNNHL